MSLSRPRLVVSADSDDAADQICQAMTGGADAVRRDAPSGIVDGLVFAGSYIQHAADLELCAQGFLNGVPDGLALIDANNRITWHNAAFQQMVADSQRVLGRPFLEALGNPHAVSPDTIPDPIAPGSDTIIKAVLRTGERDYLALRASRWSMRQSDGADSPLVSIVLRDVSEEILENQKREALYKAGIELGDLSPEEVTDMSHEDRSELLQEKILEYSQDILGFETIELRVLNPATNELVPLLQVGMQEEASSRKLFAEESGNGVTGYVAATRQSHLCRDTKTDPMYLSGAADARSSLTVPLIMHEEVLGTINVESPGAQVFDQKDLEFLEVFGCVVAMSVNQLQLLVAEQVTTATASSDRLRREVALPTDDILSSATAILEKYIGHDPDVCEKLQTIVGHTRDIRRKIGRVSEEASTADVGFTGSSRPRDERPALNGKCILVVDSDESVLSSAHDLLECHGCTVEAVRSGAEASQMARSHHYDVVLTDINLPDMNGYECFCQLQDIDDRLPVILMTGFGYDPGHSIVKSRQRGLKSVLYKPFRREQLLTEVEKAVTPPPPHH